MLGFVVNPTAGNGRGREVWKQVEQALSERCAVYRVRETTGMGEAEELAVELIQKEGVTKMIAVGGDGTVHEVINGIQKTGKTCEFGLIAAGSGNDFARGHGLAHDPMQAMERILRGDGGKTIDLLRFQQRFAVNAIGAGFDAEVAKNANEAPYKGWLGRLRMGWAAYLLSVLRVVRTYQPCDLTLFVDDNMFRLSKVWLVAVANIPNYGGGLKICPGAVSDDGEAEICVVNNIGKWSLLTALPLIFTGSHGRLSSVCFYRGRNIRIESSVPLKVHADGEDAGETPLAIEIAPGRQPICG